MRPDVAPDAVTDRKRGGSELCLACGLCCNGALHSNVTVRPEHVRLVRNLGLTLENTDGHELGFRQPCPLFQKDRCSAYPHHPPTCQQYRCALLRKYEDGDVTLKDSLTITRTAKELLAGAAEHLVAGAPVFGASLGFALAGSWDGEHGLRGSGADRQANAELLLRAVALDVHLKKHFRPPRKESDPAPARIARG
jgi:Fe-S-cluster containining protein